MAELIDRKALRKDIEERICKNCGVRNEPLACHFCKAGRVISRVENAPTVEAKPVVHAHWEDNKCSNCKEEASSRSWDELIYDYDWDENLQYSYTEHHTEYELTDFCPHCGAQMDEDHIAEGGKKENDNGT